MYVVVYIRVIDYCIGIKMGYAICVKDATVLTIGMIIFGNKGWCSINLLSVHSQFGAFEPQPLGKSIPDSYTQLYQFYMRPPMCQ